MLKALKRLFKRKKHETIYPAGGYPNPTDLYRMARSGEMVVSGKVFRQDGISDKIVEAIESNLRLLQRKQLGNCPNCGAPIHGKRCEYCGTEQ